jgi:hypothetical protein
MTAGRCILLLGCLTAHRSLPAQAGQAASAPRTVADSLLELDREWGQAYVRSDTAVVRRIVAPDWIGWFETEASTRDAELASLRTGGHRLLEDIVDRATVRVFGGTAVIQARERGRVRDATGEHWVTHHITDVFVRRNGRWMVVASHDSLIPNAP